MRCKFQDIIDLTGARVVRWHGPDTLDLVHDGSRTGRDVLFVPGRLKGIGTPLFDYLSSTKAAGILLPQNTEMPSPEQYPELGVLVVDSVGRAYAELVRQLRLASKSLFVGVTGSVGKTSTKEYIAAILRQKYKVHATQESYNRMCHCCEVIEGMSGDTLEAAVIEMGFWDPGDVEHMAYAAIPHVGVITKIAPQHIGHTGGSMAELARQKCRMAAWLDEGGFMVVNESDLSAGHLPLDQYDVPVYVFGTLPGLDAAYRDVQVSESGTSFDLVLRGEARRCRIKPVGEFQAANATAAALVAARLGFSADDIVTALESVDPLPHRFEVHRFSHGFTLVDDTHGAGFYALVTGADLAARLASGRNQVALVSGLSSLDEYGRDYHYNAGRHLVERGFREIVILGVDPDSAALREGMISAGLPAERITVILRTADVTSTLSLFVRPNTLLFCKTHYNLQVHPEIAKMLGALQHSNWNASPSEMMPSVLHRA